MWYLVSAVQPFAGQYRFDNVLHHRFFQFVMVNIGRVLGGEYDGVDTDRLVILVAESDLALGVRAQPAEYALAAHFRLALYQSVRVGNWCGHQHVGFTGGVAEHQALVTGTLVFRFGAVYALVDIRGLHAKCGQYCAGFIVETHLGAGIADILDGLAHQGFIVGFGSGGDFSGYHDHAGFEQRLAGYAGVRVFGEYGIEYGIRDLISHFVRVAFRN